MRFFFRSRQFKVILAIFCVIALLTASFAIVGKRMSPQTDIASTVATPFKTFFSNVSDMFGNMFKNYNNGRELSLENSQLQDEIDSLREQLADYEELKQENDFYKDYLGIKENNPDFTFADAVVIARDSDDPFGSFTLNKGSSSDISKYDPVITSAGIVGYVTEVGLTSCKVTTILSPEITLGALDNRTNDSGVISGSFSFAQNGYCRFSNLSRSCTVAVGDYVITSGEGIFPEGLLVGSINNIGVDETNNTIYAEVKPFAEIFEIREVMVITNFEGQGGIAIGDGK